MNRRSFFRKLAGAAASVAVATSIKWQAFEAPKFRTLKENFCQAIVDIWEDRDVAQYAAASRQKIVGTVDYQIFMKSNPMVWIHGRLHK